MPRSDRTRRAFTIAEMLIALALMALLMVAAALAIQAAQTSHAYNREKTDLVSRARGVLDRIARDVRRAESVTVAIDNHSVDVLLPDGNTHTYAWDTAVGGNMTYAVTDEAGVSTEPTVLTAFVETFSVQDEEPAYRFHLVLEGEKASAEASITATPRKLLF